MMKSYKRNCFAAVDGCCAVLKYNPSCSGCKFFKTREQLENERKKAKTRLSALSRGEL